VAGCIDAVGGMESGGWTLVGLITIGSSVGLAPGTVTAGGGIVAIGGAGGMSDAAITLSMFSLALA